MANPPPAGTGTATFKIPRAWGATGPKFTTDNKDELREFIDQCEDIISLGAVTVDQEKKILLTSYLPLKKREEWRTMPEYAAGTWAEFKKAILQLYPEVEEDRDGTLGDLYELCNEFRGIRRTQEGRLKRFGLRFRTLVTKLLKPPAVILNKEACRRYLATLDRSFAEALRTSITTRNLMKEDIAATARAATEAHRQADAVATAAGIATTLPAAAANPAAPGVDRRDDPIQLDELIKLAERLAHSGGDDESRNDEELPELRRSEKFPRVKIEERDARLEDLEGQMSGLRDAVEIGRKQQKAANEELLKAFAGLRNAGPPKEDNERGAMQVYRQGGGMPNRNGGGAYGGGYGGGRGDNSGCYYCEDDSHFARDCALKQAHVQRGWLSVDDGRSKLGDGGFIPKGAGTQAARVEDYWKRKNAVGQHMYAQGGAGLNDDEFDTLRDEIRTLRVRLNQVSSQQQAGHAPTQPAFMAAAANPVPTPPPAQPVPQSNPVQPSMEAFGRFMFNMMNGGSGDAASQFAQDSMKEAAQRQPPPEDQPKGREVEDVEKGDAGEEARGSCCRREGLTEEVLERINDTEVTVKLGDLFGLSKDLREGERLRLTKIREPVNERKAGMEAVEQAQMVGVEGKKLVDADVCQDAAAAPKLRRDALEIDNLPSVEGVFVLSAEVDGMPQGALVAQDPYLQYLEGLEDEETPKQIYVARDSVPLRVTFPQINSQGPVECVLDSGSQIVSMSLEVAQQCGLVWDPNINIYMQSANGQLEKSMGLAQNVPFPYKVLLGRPFDVLTKSKTEHTDGEQLLTLTDPNSGRAWNVPTFDRTRVDTKKDAPEVVQANFLGCAPAGFRQSSMN
ncbi:CCHC-type domain-containing protein [Mycena kentingensis (nom. inval.)]|nr:CCHC-type domain-containing protein [Mycena kentingensis (nom. inval.)]